MKINFTCQDPRLTPKRANPTDAGADLRATEDTWINPGTTAMIDTGVAVAIPPYNVGLVFNRSSQGKQGIKIPHSVGVIDSDYRGNIKVLLENTSEVPYKIEGFNTRIAQLVIVPIVLVEYVLADTLPSTVRGTGGFGSTGA